MNSHSFIAHPNLPNMIVYKITNLLTGKFYIGKTAQALEKRWIQHCTPRSGCRYLSKSIRKYGKENFEIKVLTYCNNIEEMNHREQYYIRLFNTLAPDGYNLMTGGGNSLPSKEVLKKRSNSLKQFYKNNKPNPISEETRKKISIKGKGRKRSAKSIAATALAHSIPVFQYDLDGFFIARYISARKAKEVTGIGNEEIGKCCKSIKRTAGGFQWSYLESPNIGKVRNKKPIPKRGAGNASNSRSVAKVNHQGEIIETYLTAKEAAIKNSCDQSTILKVCKGKQKNTKGLLFIFFKNLG